MEATTRFTAPRVFYGILGLALIFTPAVIAATSETTAHAYARGVCDHARDSRLLQPGRYDDCVRAVTKNPEDR